MQEADVRMENCFCKDTSTSSEASLLARFVLLRLAASPRMEAFVRRSPLSAPLVRRFVAGSTMEEAARIVRGMNERGLLATLDLLGENVTTRQQAEEATERCAELVRFARGQSLNAYLSVKLTQLGLDIATDFACRNLERVVSVAAECDRFVRVDMESSQHVDRTLEVFYTLWPRYRNIGLVFQSYLYRTAEDVERAIQEQVQVRLVKGAYNEPPSVAFPRKRDVDANYVRLAHRLLSAGPYPAIATHDTRIIAEVKRYCREQSIGPDRFEFQMLYGIRRDLQEALIQEGYRMRVYTPFGTEWYGYTMRRLAERPANLWFVLKNLLRR